MSYRSTRTRSRSRNSRYQPADGLDGDSIKDDDFQIDDSKDGIDDDDEEEDDEEEDVVVAQKVEAEEEPEEEGMKAVDAEDDEDHIRPHRTRARRQVNYNEDSYLKAIDDAVDDDEDEDAIGGTRRTSTRLTRGRSRNRVDNDAYVEDPDNVKEDDEFIASENDALDDDDYLDGKRPSAKRIREPGFIVKDEDDDDEDEDGGYGRKKVRLSSNSSMRNSRNRSGNSRYNTRSSNKWSALLETPAEDSNKPVTLQDELRDLQNDSPLNSPKRNLRHRKDVNYTLPPPYLTEAQLEEMDEQSQTETSPRKGRINGRFGGANNNVSSSIRRLFPTMGPFGGSDVHSLFQSNIVPSGLSALANAESSDSDDENDLIKPTDPNDTSIMNNVNPSNILNMGGGSNIISASTAPNKKKNTLADTDPLGIDTNIDFSVVGGLDNYINQLKEMITLPLLYPEVYSKFHITPPRGVLFHGPPGTGKTLMARALAASCSSQNKKITFFMRKGADCLSKWVGEAERHLRLLFEEAKQHQPSIIFFDEIDGLAPVRSSKQEQIHASIVSTLLALMDGMDNRGQVIIIGATNRPDSIDSALRRPGRFDREFYFPLPDLNARKEILKIHMRKWENQLDDEFIDELAVLTKGYGGADLRALCTESALNSIQRSYPQIYETNDKLKIDITKIVTTPSDFTRALRKIVPNSARSTSNVSEPLPEVIKPLLEKQFDAILDRLHAILPTEKEVSLLEEAKYESLNNNFKKQQLIKNFDSMRVFKPRIAINGSKSQGLKYLSNAILNKLEGFTIQILDLGKIFSDSSISAENLCVQLFSELKRHKPSILFIPDTIGFLSTVSESLRATIKYLIRGLNNNEKILIYCELECNPIQFKEYAEEIEDIFDISEDEIVDIRDASLEERDAFFQSFWKSIYMTPNDYNDISIRPLKKQPVLEVVPMKPNDDDILKKKDNVAKTEKELARKDMSLKNSLKVKLAGLLDIFKARYKRFKKPIIDDHLLVHLFDETPNLDSNYQIRDDKILEISTNKLYHNMDMEIIEERLWNGFYSEPRQFLHDIELILKDAKTSGERERLLKANEMYAHAAVGVEEIEMQFPLLAIQWKEVARREKQRITEYAKIRKNREAEVASTADVEAPETPQSTEAANGEVNGLALDKAEEKILDEETNAVLDEGNDKPEEDINMDGKIQSQAQLQPGQKLDGSGDVDSQIPVEPVTLVEPVEKLEVESRVEALEETTGIESPAEVDGIADKQLMSEPEFQIELQEVKCDASAIEKLQQLLLQKTERFKLIRLERINSKLCGIAWKHRLSLDKSSLVEELAAYISSLS